MTISAMTIEKATLQEEVDNMRAEEAQMREENKVYKTLLLDKQTYEERLRKLENERERKVDVEQEYANLRRKCAALEANADSLSTQLLELSAANAELTRAKADREAAKSLAESKAVEHMREKTVSERQRDKLVADNRKLTAENDELNKTYSEFEQARTKVYGLFKVTSWRRKPTSKQRLFLQESVRLQMDLA